MEEKTKKAKQHPQGREEKKVPSNDGKRKPWVLAALWSFTSALSTEFDGKPPTLVHTVTRQNPKRPPKTRSGSCNVRDLRPESLESPDLVSLFYRLS